MTLTRICLIATSLLLTLPGSGLASAQPAELADALRACLGRSDNLARLTCYDDLARQLPGTAAEPETATLPAPAASGAEPAAVAERVAAGETAPVAEAAQGAEPERSRVAAFGQPTARVAADDEGAGVLIDTVVEARRVEPTKWLLTLQSGQVWRQSVGKNHLIRPGDTVRIQASSWGSDFRLSVDGRRGYIQVKRQE